METFDAICTRRSIRKYTDIQIDYSIIEKIIASAMQAPSARNLQAWHFVVSQNRLQLNQLSAIHPYGKMLSLAGCAILVCGDLSVEPEIGYNAVNCGAAIQNILLTAHNEGLGAVWLGVYPRQSRILDMASFFDLPGNIIPIGLVSIGWPNESLAPVNRFDPAKIHFEKW